MKLNLNFATKNILKTDPKNYVKIDIDVSDEKNNIKQSTERKPVFLIPVIDRSGSMSQSLSHSHDFSMRNSKLECAKNATKELIDLLIDGDKIAIVTFDDMISVVQNPITINKSAKKEIFQNINKIASGGCTNISDAIKTANNLFTKADAEKYNCKIVLLSDGYANAGFDRSEQFIPLMCDILSKGISTSTVGIGIDYDLDIMETISNNCAGSFTHVSNANEIKDVFATELKTTQSIVARDTIFKIKLPDLVSFKPNLNNFAETTDKDFITLNFGNLYNNKTIYYEFEVLDTTVEKIKIEISLSCETENGKKELSISEELMFVSDKKDLIENSDIIKEILETVRDKYNYEAAKAYSLKDSVCANNCFVSASNTINSISASYTSASACASEINSEITATSCCYATSSDDQLRSNVSSISKKLRNS